MLIDCAPSLGILTINALAAADEVFIPLQPHFFALHGLSKLLETTALVARRINPGLRVTGVIVCLYDGATRLAQEVVRDLRGFLDASRSANVPWAHARVFESKVRRNVKLAECPSFGKTIFEYRAEEQRRRGLCGTGTRGRGRQDWDVGSGRIGRGLAGFDKACGLRNGEPAA